MEGFEQISVKLAKNSIYFNLGCLRQNTNSACLKSNKEGRRWKEKEERENFQNIGSDLIFKI